MDVEEEDFRLEEAMAHQGEVMVREGACEEAHRHQAGMGMEMDEACAALVLDRYPDPAPWVEEHLHLDTTMISTPKAHLSAMSRPLMEVVADRRLSPCKPQCQSAKLSKWMLGLALPQSTQARTMVSGKAMATCKACWLFSKVVLHLNLQRVGRVGL